MTPNEIVGTLRLLSDYSEDTLTLPIEMVDLIKGRKDEASWEEIEVKDVLRYISDMLEE